MSFISTLDDLCLSFDLPIAVAFSGGKDSLALLLSMVEKFGVNNIYAFHVDHGVRDKKSCDEEVAFIEKVCQKINVQLESQRLLNLKNKSEDHLRQLRYHTLQQVASEKGIKTIALAHHKFDQSESFLMHLLRGSDIKGLTGMREEFSINGTRFIRPMLKTHPNQISEYLVQRGYEAFEDPTNLQNVYKRNRIRNELFPLLEELQPGVTDRLAELSSSFKEIEDWKNMCLSVLSSSVIEKKNSNGEIIISKKYFTEVAIPVIKAWCYQSLSRWAGGEQSINRRHVESLFFALKSENTGYLAENFPGKVQIRVRKREIVIKFL